MDKFSFIANADTVAIDELYKVYKDNPENVDLTWQKFFQGFDFSIAQYGENNGFSKSGGEGFNEKELYVYNLIRSYRRWGHLNAKTNPVRERKDRQAGLNLPDFGLTDADLTVRFKAGKEIGLENATLKEIIDILRKVYVGSFGFEYTYIRQPNIQKWLRVEFEKAAQAYNPPVEIKKRILSKLNEAVVFENFLATKYVGQKRFGLEGGENTIVAIDTIINVGSMLGIEEVVIGMAHRGRLNVLCNVMGKTYEQIFNEFEGNIDINSIEGAGDVKYHMGYSSETKTIYDKKVALKLMPNPSHLEAVDPLVLGYTRAQIDDEYQGDFKKAIPILIHGDAAVAGQGVVYETVQMANLPGYTTGGTIHFVINNQVGFTTDFDDARSGIYCTDVAKIIDAPVIHVNGDDAEAVAFAAKTAIEFRQHFGKDIFIDMVCYRKNGHNESDEPRFTQPKLYSLISKHPNPREIYKADLIARGAINEAQAEEMDKQFKELLQSKQNLIKEKPLPYQPQKMEQEWLVMKKAKSEDFDKSPDTSIKKATIDKIAKALTTLPADFKPLKQIENLIKERNKMFNEDKKLNWASAELMAYGSLLLDGNIVRMSGQDVKRGTFSHRHAYFFDSETNASYCQIDNIDPKQEKFKIYNSLLSEFGVLGFEYGYAMATPNALVIWEAQFGDFSNGAQTLIDQFISSAETKWQRQNGLVMLLPHGMEGQGPEHSSARPERFLQLAAENNMIVANLTTPANIFHLMRRQVTWKFRKPCVVMSPKSLLRHPQVVSPIEDFTKGGFKEVIDDAQVKDAAKVTRVLFCTGKVYFDLLAEQQASKRNDVAVVRIEQLYPFPEKQINELAAKYKNAHYYWVQEEPENMGYWSYIVRIYRNFYWNLVARKPSSSPATGYNKIHVKEQAELVKQAYL
jgi:2-oxoglutarate dehydrogenase E1 component